MTSYYSYHYVRHSLLPLFLLGASTGLWAQPQIPSRVPMNTIPTRVLGHAQTKLSAGVPNLIEELWTRPFRERSDSWRLKGIGHDASRERTACQRSRTWMAE